MIKFRISKKEEEKEVVEDASSRMLEPGWYQVMIEDYKEKTSARGDTYIIWDLRPTEWNYENCKLHLITSTYPGSSDWVQKFIEVTTGLKIWGEVEFDPQVFLGHLIDVRVANRMHRNTTHNSVVDMRRS